MLTCYDLHTHTNHSDGSLSPEDLVARAEAVGVTMLAITDHDTISAIPSALQAANHLEIIPGIEFSSRWQSVDIHILGLAIDIHHPDLLAGIAEQQSSRERRNRAIAERLTQLGVPNAYEGTAALNRDHNLGRVHFAQYLVQCGFANDFKQAFTRYLKPGKPAFVEQPWLDFTIIIKLIKQAGGFAVLAHPLEYQLKSKRLRQLLRDFKQAGGDGLEIISAQTPNDKLLYLARLAEQFDLYSSQGSDFHGDHMPWRQLGRFATLPAKARPIWKCWQS
ncbi:MAG: PHP domain-containing protein [Legionellales bacterium]|nr:PHP domain-containing protein [Legionellales bacterium]